MLVKCIITAYKYSFYRLRGILLPLLFKVCTGTDPMDALKVQSSNSNTKVSRVPRQSPQVYLKLPMPMDTNLHACGHEANSVAMPRLKQRLPSDVGPKNVSEDISEHQKKKKIPGGPP